MSAILGLVDYDGGLIDRKSFDRSFDIIKRYGPDHSQALVGGSVAFGVHALETTGYQSAKDIKDSGSSTWIVADAILDNRRSIGRELEIDEQALADLSDPDLIRLSYEKWGASCVERLDGDFAFACYSSASNELFLARDHIGSRPLYWARRGSTFLFSSSVQALIEFRDLDWRINETAVARYLAAPFSVSRESFFSGVHNVLPGGHLVANASGEISTKWWQPRKQVSPRSSDPNAVVSECTKLLQTSIAKRATSQRPVGSHFSGGVDSTGITVIAARVLKNKDEALAAAYMWAPSISDQYPADELHDERERLSPLIAKENIPVRFGSSDPGHLLDLLSRSMEFETHSDLADEFPILSRAEADGIGILLSGWGGDEVFSSHGMGYFAYLLSRGRVAKAAQLAHRQYPSLKSISVLKSIFRRNILPYMLPEFVYDIFFTSKDTSRKSFASATLRQAHQRLFERPPSGFRYGLNPNKNIRGFVTSGHIEMRMEAWASWSADHDLQYRYPLTDRSLLEFLFALHPEDLYMNNVPRGLAKAVLSDVIPPTASKSDPANERHRADKRRGVLREIAERIDSDYYSDDCPWIDKERFFEAAKQAAQLEGKPQDYAFTGVFAAARAWEMYRRARANDWL